METELRSVLTDIANRITKLEFLRQECYARNDYSMHRHLANSISDLNQSIGALTLAINLAKGK